MPPIQMVPGECLARTVSLQGQRQTVGHDRGIDSLKPCLEALQNIIYTVHLLCRLQNIATHRDHFVRRLSLSHYKLCFAGDT